MNKLEKILGQQFMPDDSILQDLKAITETEFNQRELKRGGILSILIDCYQYGVIQGKRQERARYKKL